MKPIATILAAALAVLIALPTTAAELPAAYTADQATQGETAFAQSCGGCHGFDMIGIFHTYPSAKAYWDFITVSMPFDQPGTLSPRRYLSIIAWLMRENGFPAGDTALSDSVAVLNSITPTDAPGAAPVAQ